MWHMTFGVIMELKASYHLVTLQHIRHDFLFVMTLGSTNPLQCLSYRSIAHAVSTNF